MERRSTTRFSPSEIARMEKLVSSDRKEQVLVDSFCQKLVEEFNRSPARVGSRALQATQVRGWFLDKLPASTPKPASLPTTSEEKPLASEPDALVSEIKTSASEEKALALDTSISNNEDALSPDLPKETTDKVPEFEDLQFEAKSSKDSAWYDVALFLAHRKTSLGEVEVRVRFIGYGAEEDEWVNVRKAVRQQSIPLESSECRSIVKGDLVLCFKESNDEALHFDAHVVDVQRKQHDIRGCRCLFHVEYDHDQSQEMVNLKRISRRPRYL
ncbi:protein SAWADEE HOMEODOMAIN HOMOLOG 2-like [Triticum urartu]|uniref:SAWADEE domain-containing protein n=5 Tax=Triticum TaxID=4564 RepID=A0A8R7UFI6_TRIUA|nr:protein SAWADEE HOMEODOMAIN HOMOLOG 2-like [Triticum aestivum]XP_048530026.1 protein SAWADEE HOMEODOMAIN HOMOLOG 2-like [Triticum urartu]